MTEHKDTFQYSMDCKLPETQYEAEKGSDMSFLEIIHPVKYQNAASIESKELKTNENNSCASSQSLELYQAFNKYVQSETELEENEILLFNGRTQLIKLNDESNQNIISASNADEVNQQSKTKRKRRGKRAKNKAKSDLHWLSKFPSNDNDENEYEALHNNSDEIELIISADVKDQIEGSSMELEPISDCLDMTAAEHSIRKVINQEIESNSDESDIDINFATLNLNDHYKDEESEDSCDAIIRAQEDYFDQQFYDSD